ncbi:MAG TPA: hypothetical protein VLC08_12520 [Chitinolyticbacter sp.]|nr:hypothetical protein [Chitinolyticbacter sp.]
MDTDDLDNLVGKWHDFADQPAQVIHGQFTENGIRLTNLVVLKLLGQTGENEFTSADQFTKFVIELRQNERAWSSRLGEILINANSLVSSGDTSSARKVFDEFEVTCPWLSFVSIARTQRENTLP